MSYRRSTLLFSALLAVVILAVPACSRPQVRFFEEKGDCYALLVVAADDMNAAVHHNLDPVDVNGAEVALSRVYGALKRAGYDDSCIVVLYCKNGLQLDWSEKKNADIFKALREKHFTRPDYEATKSNIIRAMKQLREIIDENDQFVFWIAAHGEEDGSLNLARKGKWTGAEIRNAFSGLKSRASYLLFDACFSGRILEKLDIDNAAIFASTGSNTPGWLDREFSNCAYFLECKLNEKLDANKDGIVDCDEAFSEAKSHAVKYEPEFKEYLKTKYKPNRKLSEGALEKQNIIPCIKTGRNLLKTNLGPVENTGQPRQ